MFKLVLLIALSIAGASGQEQPNVEAAPEPYSYGYETDTHAASEQRDPSGKVTGFYTLADADGRSRRVEYYADETGFHAKVQTNEVGTKSESPADVEVVAAPPNAEQLVYQAPPQPQVSVQQPQRVVSQQVVAQPYRTSTAGVQYLQQPGYYGYGYNYPGYASGYNYPGYGYSTVGQRYGYGLSGASQYGYGINTVGVGNYNNHLPSQYYRSVSTQVQPASVSGYYTQSVPVGVSYSTGSAPGSVTYSSSSAQPAGGVRLGSSNYVVLKKREAEK